MKEEYKTYYFSCDNYKINYWNIKQPCLDCENMNRFKLDPELTNIKWDGKNYNK